MFSGKLANLLSHVLGPQVWLPVLVLFMLVETGLTNQQIAILSPAALILLVLVPLAYLFFAPRLGLAESWELIKKEERRLFMLVTISSSAIFLILVYIFGSSLLMKLYLTTFITLSVIFTITYFWKISLHVSLNTFGSLMTNYLFDWNLPVLYLSIPLIFWARYRLKRHTIIQLLMGFVVPTLITITVLFIVL